MYLEGNSGHRYNMDNEKGIAQYILDSFEAACSIGHEHCYNDLSSMIASDMIDMFCPEFVLLENGGKFSKMELNHYVATEMRNLRNKLTKKGGASVSLENYNGEEVDDLLLFKAIDFVASLEKYGDMEAYKQAERDNKETLDKCDQIARKYGAKIEPKTLEKMQVIFYGIVDSGKYGSDPVGGSVAGALLEKNWRGLGEWI